jgi:hypothetical protein
MGTFAIVTMDDTDISYGVLDTRDDAGEAQVVALEYIASLGGMLDGVCDTAQARADLDIDGDVVWSVYGRQERDAVRTLVAIVNVDATGEPRHADNGGDGGFYPDETVIVSIDAGSIYRIGGTTLALRDRRTGAWVGTGQ